MSTSHDHYGRALLQAIEYALTSVTALVVVAVYPYLFFDQLPIDADIADLQWVEGMAVTMVIFLALFLFCKHYFATEGTVFKSLLSVLVVGVGAFTAGLTLVLFAAPELAAPAINIWFLLVACVCVFVILSIWVPHEIAKIRRRQRS